MVFKAALNNLHLMWALQWCHPAHRCSWCHSCGSLTTRLLRLLLFLLRLLLHVPLRQRLLWLLLRLQTLLAPL